MANSTPGNYRVLISLGTVDDADHEIIEYLLWENTHGQPLRLTAVGCHCCGNAHDIPLSEGTPCDLTTAADELWIFWDENYTGRDAAEAAIEIELGLGQARELSSAEPLT